MDVQRIKDYLQLNGYECAENAEDADTCIVGTCISNSENEFLNFQIASGLKKKNPGMDIIFAGCGPRAMPGRFKDWKTFASYDQIEGLFPPEKVTYAEVPLPGYPEVIGRNFTLGDSRPVKFSKHLAAQRAFDRFNERAGEGFLYEGAYGTRKDKYDVHFVLISRGCNLHCSYCLIRKGIGPYRSVPKKEILEQIERGYSKGHRKFMLLSNEASFYGTDMGGHLTLKELLDELFQKFPEAKFGFHSISPLAVEKAFKDADMERYADRLFFLMVPIQSGSEQVLKRMNRPGNLEEVKRLLLEFRKYYRGILATEVMFGLPGETNEEAQKTARYIVEAGFDRVRIYEFSPRPGTPLEKEKLCKDASKHLKIIQDTKRYISVRYLHRVLSKFSGRSFMKKELQIPRESVPRGMFHHLRTLDWSGWQDDSHVLFAHPEFPDFEARLHGSTLAFRLKRDGGWEEFSEELRDEEIIPIIESLEGMIGKGKPVSLRRRSATKDGQQFFLEKVPGQGDFLRILDSSHGV